MAGEEQNEGLLSRQEDLRRRDHAKREEGEKTKLREIIAKEWALYLEHEILAFSHIDIRLSNYKENFTRVEKVYNKLRTYEKLSQLGKEFDTPIN